MEIVPVKVDDLNEVYCLGRKVFGEIAHSSLVIRQLWDQNHPFIWAAKDPQITGYCIGGIEAHSKIGHIMSLAVDPEARRKRIGYLLSQKVMSALADSGVTTFKLVCSPSNNGAIALYEALGFIKGEVVSNYFGEGAHRLTMSRPV